MALNRSCTQETSWVGFEKVYHSDVDIAGGVRSTTISICRDRELNDPANHKFKYKSKVYDMDTSSLPFFPIEQGKEYFAHVNYTNSTEGENDQWTGWNFYVPIKVIDLSEKLPKGYTFTDNAIKYRIQC